MANPKQRPEEPEYFSGRHRDRKKHSVRVSVTVDPGLLSFVDDFVEHHKKSNRSEIFDQALEMWVTKQQELNDISYYTKDKSLDGSNTRTS